MAAAFAQGHECKPLCRNHWGDGMYFCFAHPAAAADFALKLCGLTSGTHWQPSGLPDTLRIRVALHCGPAFKITDPVIHQLNYTGWHVSRAARMKAITPPNSVYASQQFAAIAACFRIPNLVFEYAGTLSLAKDYGRFPMYLVRRGDAKAAFQSTP